MSSDTKYHRWKYRVPEGSGKAKIKEGGRGVPTQLSLGSVLT